ncbi:hypothetical protein BDZ89DRAFT_1099290 [Hymenopellis radicata]|nr:hypothetical protein BDZ89DRAFT_1099290 [Hymenopellis radicata]
MSSRIPLSSRPLDLLYFSFFIMHIPASLLVDLQALLYPNTYLPSLPEWYTGYSADPLIRGAMLKESQLVWFNCFLYVEMIFQLPVFVIGALGLWKGSKSIYVLLLAYAASTATTTLPCIAFVIHRSDSLTTEQLVMLLSSYIPFFLLPFAMAVDMALRLQNIVQTSLSKVTTKIE